jgi:hypothetical protein
VREAVAAIQQDILDSFAIVEDKNLAIELKLIDMISFLYEISQSTPAGFAEKRENFWKRCIIDKRKWFNFCQRKWA